MTSNLRDRLYHYAHLMRLHKPIGIYLLLWPTLWALWIASEGQPDLKTLFIFCMGVVLTRSGGCVINDYADRDFDGHVSRTQDRPIVSGKVSTREALLLAAGLGMIAFILVLFTNRLTIILSVGGLLLATAYPFMKRYTYFPQVVLGAAFAWAVPMAFAATQGEVPTIAWLLYMATVLWTVAYDTLYAMADRPEDLKIGVKSTAILFGDADLPIIALLEFITLLTLVVLGNQLDLSYWYYMGLAIAVALWGMQLWSVRKREPHLCLRAFLNNHWVGAAIFCGLFLHYSLS